MLFAVEGGGFFSSSASGYSKGLTLLLLGQKNEEKPMRVTPLNQYQLVEQETDPDLPLASEKNRHVRGCASFVCFGRAAPGLESPSPLQVGPAHNQEVLPEPQDFDESNDQTGDSVVGDDDYDSTKKIISLKSSLKKRANSAPVPAPGGGCGVSNEREVLCSKENDVTCRKERRKVQWTDTIGGELYEIREFEMSEDGSDDEFDHGNEKSCSCTIM